MSLMHFISFSLFVVEQIFFIHTLNVYLALSTLLLIVVLVFFFCSIEQIEKHLLVTIEFYFRKILVRVFLIHVISN